MNNTEALYAAIFKRKSFHLFRGVGDDKLTKAELDSITPAFQSFAPLCPGIRTAIRIVKASEVNFKRDAEYCILLFSEKKENYLMNAGYLGEQLDLWLVSHNIGTLWFGIGKPDEPTYDGMDFVIMIAIHKVNDDTKYRKDLYKAKRKPLSEVWSGDTPAFADLTRFAPSACNSQPWFTESNDGTLTVSRYKKPGKRGIMPASAVSYFNRIDIGIYLCFLELILHHEHISFTRTLFPDDGADREYTKSAEYNLCRSTDKTE